MELTNFLNRVLLQYRNESSCEFIDNPLAIYVRSTYPQMLKRQFFAETNYIIKGSVGQGNWSDIPWLAFLNPLITDTTSRGYYVCYLFDSEMRHAYLSLAQGVTILKEDFPKSWKEALKSRNQTLARRVAPLRKDVLTGEIDLQAKTSLSKAYEHSSAFHIQYKLEQIPSEEVLQQDLNYFLSLYEDLIKLGGADFVEQEVSPEEEGSLSFKEKKTLRLHRLYEGRVNSAKLKKHLSKSCEVCEFNFEEKYGTLGKSFIEAHHLQPFSNLEAGTARELSISDFASLCANCHRMIHKMTDPSDLDALRNIIKGAPHG